MYVSAPSACLCLWRPLDKRELPFQASLLSLETCHYRLFRLQRLGVPLNTPTLPPPRLWGVFYFSEHAGIRPRVCATGGGDSDYRGGREASARFPERVGEGQRVGGFKGQEEGK